MGITESKLLVASFSRACSEAETTDSLSQNILTDPLVQSQIKNILSDPRVASYATPIWKALPAVARNKITGRKSPTQRAVKKIPAIITPSQDLKHFAEKCKGNPQYFFQSINRNFDLQFPLAQCYKFLADKGLSKLQRRTFFIIFARLKARLGHTRVSSVARGLLIFILQRTGVVQDASHIDENFGDWASRGERLEGLTAACGGLDALFVLPGISDSDD
ncbi:hypothetical protein I7I51_07924 [Histoplasma capsulatum]|uniref:Uncharacterized protein n=1 Tax=Ajellomyces capsulatus TaxID=5037 RepID=A0A8A1M2S9_AJECA|nr:predicted protein [Histoplasma mississippiense (nom. inval.)]EDN02892.1 predicted protein [Histoplasma mississippiense (nom. inval.)]QSS58497.1 hypothetical protein I7I51_07924 [Histoplasma capsulatum]